MELACSVYSIDFGQFDCISQYMQQHPFLERHKFDEKCLNVFYPKIKITNEIFVIILKILIASMQ